MNRKPDKTAETDDARGQFAHVEAGATNNGVSSARPRVISGTDDVTEASFLRDEKGKGPDDMPEHPQE